MNQDTGAVWSWTSPAGMAVSVAAVADGVSAGRHSERASRLAVAAVGDGIAPLREDSSADLDGVLAAVLAATQQASKAIAGDSASMAYDADATTIAAAVCAGDQVAGIWCGDSRVYQLTATGVDQVTRDHSWVERVVAEGIMSSSEAEADPRARAITRWLGPQEDNGPAIDTFRLQTAPGDIILCCSDGVYLYYSEPEGHAIEMQRILRLGRGALTARLERLMSLAIERGGHDDLTAAAIQVELY